MNRKLYQDEALVDVLDLASGNFLEPWILHLPNTLQYLALLLLRLIQTKLYTG